MFLMPMSAVGFGAFSADTGYTIENAIWLDGSADYLTWTPGGAGSRRAWSASMWIKKADDAGGDRAFFSGDSSGAGVLRHANGDALQFDENGGTVRLTTSAVYRDYTAWQNVVAVWDSDDSTSGDRMRIFINGARVTSFSSETQPSINADGSINQASVPFVIGAGADSGPGQFFKGYMAEVVFLDGTASEDASEFGESDDNGVWVPIKPPSSLGTNGFHLDFAVAPGTGNGAGTDVSGNDNHFTDVSMTTAQQVIDTPTDDVDNNIGNHALWNPLDVHASYVPTFSNGNLTATGNSGSVYTQIRGTIGISSGKFVIQITPSSTLTNGAFIGVIRASDLQDAPNSGPGTKGILCRSDNTGQIYNDGTAVESSIGTWDSGNDMRVEVNADDGTVAFFKDGSAYGSAVSSLTFDEPWVFTWMPFGTYVATLEHSIAAMDGTVTSGFKEWNTANLPEPTVTNLDDGFVQVLNTGANIESALATARSGHSTYMEIFKDLDGSTAWQWRFSDDASNGLDCESTAAKTTFVAPSGSNDFVGWSFNMNATHGMFTAEVSHSNGSDTNTAHSLGSGLKMAVVKITNTTGAWYWSHPGMTSGYNISLNTHSPGEQNSTVYAGIDDTNVIVKSAAPTGTYRVIAIVEVAGFSSLPTLLGNGDANGPFVYTGMQPEFMISRRHTTGCNTFAYVRQGSNPENTMVEFDDPGGTSVIAGASKDWCATGFKQSDTNNDFNQTSVRNFIWAIGRSIGGDGVAQAKAR